jgi:hypothetical protein
VPGRTSGEALEEYTEPIRQTLRCVTDSFIGYWGGRIGNLTFVNESVARLRATEFGLSFSQQYRLVQAQDTQLWRAQTRGYFYTVYDCSGDNPQEIFSYQWHPQTSVIFPHVHFKKGEPRIARAHLPTGRISIESVVEFLILDLKVRPNRDDWSDTVRVNREIFEKYRSWS